MARHGPPELPPTPDARVAAWCARQHGVVTRGQARQAGMTRAMERRRLATGRLYEIHRGVFALTPTLGPDGRRAAALLWSGGALGHESVLHVYGLIDEPAKIHVICPTGRTEPDGVRVHRSRSVPRSDIRYVRRLRATTVARALLDVAPRTAPDALRRLVHEAQFRRLVDPLSLAATIEAHPGHPGLANLRAIDPAPRGTESELERRLRRALRLVPGPPPTRQFALTLPSGRRIRADAAYVEERVLVEADGRTAHARMLAFGDDRARDNETLELGWTPLRYTWADVERPETLARQVTAILGR